MAQTLPVVSPERMTAGWITKALQNNGIDATVRDYKTEPVGTGQLGDTIRFYLDYDGATPPDAPASVVGKFPSGDATAAKTGKEMGFYRSELMFYKELAHRARIRTPFPYAAELDPVTNEFTLLLEDMAPARQGDHMSGCSVDLARAALKEAALLHSAFWNDQELAGQDWLYVPKSAQGFYTSEIVQNSWAYFRKTYAHQMDPDVITACEKFFRAHDVWNAPRALPKTFSHNDFRVDNMLFGGPRVAVVDWQTSAYLGTGMDVAYFLGGAFDRDTRRAVERDLLREYLEELQSHGVSGYDFDHLMADYRHYSWAVVVVAVAATVIVKQTERGDRLFMKMVTDGTYQAIDNGAVDTLPD